MANLVRAGGTVSSQEQRYRCTKCRSRFAVDMAVNVPIEVYVAQMKTLRCPTCGAGPRGIAMGEGRTREEDLEERIEGSIERRAENWKKNGETGVSSETIWRHMLGMHQSPDRGSHPHDVDDLRRCVLLLEHVPEWNARMAEMARLSPTWKRLADHWDEIVSTYREESPNYDGKAPRTAEMMQRLTRQED